MISQAELKNILFIDVETVPQARDYAGLDKLFVTLWNRKAQKIATKEEDTPENLYQRAGIYAEFGKIICISSGYFHNGEFRIKSFYGDDEKEILIGFASLLEKHFYRPEHKLCAHNGKEFDFPYIARRMLINGVPLPKMLCIQGKKPWEIQHLDTMELWKFGDYKNFTSLELLAAVLGIHTPKDDINGSEVARVYWEEQNLQRIVKYCQKDVLTIAQVLLRFSGAETISDEKVIIF
jgi:hypothetical protein